MLYGLYLSATGVMTNAYRQDVIANNLANSETVGFKRDVPLFRQRLTEAQEQRRSSSWSDPVLEGLGGGTLALPTRTDFQPGGTEETGSPFDVAIQGSGFFAVDDKGQTRLTRDGRFLVARDGSLVSTDGHKVLSADGRPILVSPDAAISIDADGQINQNGQAVARLGLFDVNEYSGLKKLGGNLLEYSDTAQIHAASDAVLRSGFLERSNVEPTTEMAELMNTQRQLEANANMIQAQDSTLQRLVNDVGKIS